MQIKIWVLAGLLGASVCAAEGQAATVSGTSKACAAAKADSSEAAVALRHGESKKADDLYRAEFDKSRSVPASAGLVRALLREDKLVEALEQAESTHKAHPADALAILSVGEARYRRGEVDLAAPLFIQAEKTDGCLARAYMDLARYLQAVGLFATAEKQLAMAYRIDPTDTAIRNAYLETNPNHLTVDARIAQLQEWKAEQGLSDEDKKALDRSVQALQVMQHGRCTLTTPTEHAVIPLIKKDDPRAPQVFVDTKLNGHKATIQLDTGASGIYITRRMAESAGLKREMDIRLGGVGDHGAAKAYLAVVDDFRVGNLEFHNCPVQVSDSDSPIALIGGDVFRKFLVTIDVPLNTMTLDPLPQRPGQTPPAVGLSTRASADTHAEDAVEDHLEDRYIAPSQKDWTQVLRLGHLLMVPTRLNNGPVKLMVVDTGAGLNLLSLAAAKEVTKVSGSSQQIMGISGEVSHVFKANNMNMRFLGVQMTADEITVNDQTSMSRGEGMELSGLIGFTVLQELKLQIDYRDNLVKATYDPTKGNHPGIRPQ